MIPPPSKNTNARPTDQTGTHPNADRRQVLLRSIALLAIPTFFIFAAVKFFMGDWVHGLLNFGVGLAVTLNMICLARLGKTQIVLRNISALIGLLLLYDMAKGGAYGEMLHWMYGWPLLVFFSHGKKEGLLWMIPMLLVIQIFLWLPPAFLDIHPYPQAVKVRFLVSYTIVAALAFFFESTRQVFQEGLLSERAKIVDANRSLQETNDKLKHEIRQRRKLERKLERASKMEAVGALAGGVAHDLNNILSGLVSYPDLVLMDLPPDSPLRQPIETMQASGKKAAAIVQDLLTLARRSATLPESADLNQVIGEYLESPEYRTLQHDHDSMVLDTELAADLMPVAGSPVQLSKAIMNLVANSAEAMPAGGPIRITTANRHIENTEEKYESLPPGEYAVVTVSDTGVGISNEDRERIFEPFYTRKKMGRSVTGLGMSIVWATVKDHQGFIDLESTEGRGTTIHLLFPISRQAPRANPARTQICDLSGRGESVLVVDDMAEQREIAGALLKRLGYVVDTAASGEAAVGIISGQPYDVVLLDMIMEPGMDGLETFLRIRKIVPHQSVILASGYSKNERVRQALSRGASTYLRKPYTLEMLGHAVRKALAGSHPAAAVAAGDISA